MSETESEAIVEVTTQSPEETVELGRILGTLLQAGDVIALQGDLGAGKTTLVQGVARGLGVDRPVTSPTFILVNEYPSSPRLYHVDCYRLADAPAEAASIGLAEILYDDGICAIEWADRLEGLLPDERLDVRLVWQSDTARRIILRARGRRYIELLVDLARRWKTERT